MQIIRLIGGALSGKTLFIEGDCLFRTLLQAARLRCVLNKFTVIAKNLKKNKTGKMAEDKQFDIIGALISEEGKIGENLSTQIFSQLDISSLVRVRRVSRTWNQFLKKQKSIWMEKLRRTESFLGHLDWELFSGRKGLNNPYNLGKEICNRQCFAFVCS